MPRLFKARDRCPLMCPPQDCGPLSDSPPCFGLAGQALLSSTPPFILSLVHPTVRSCCVPRNPHITTEEGGHVYTATIPPPGTEATSPALEKGNRNGRWLRRNWA